MARVARAEIGLEVRLKRMDAELKEATNKLRSLANNVKGINKEMAASAAFAKKFVAGFAGVVGATLTVKGLGSAFLEAAAAGDQLSSLEDNFKQLGGSAESLESARKGLLGLASDVDILKASNEGLLKLGPQFDQYVGQIAELSARMSGVVGGNNAEQFQKTISAISTGTAKAMREVGIFIEDTGNKSQNARAGIRALQESIDRLAPAGDSVANAYDRMRVSQRNAFAEFGKGINASRDAAESFNRLSRVLDSIDWERAGRGIAQIAGALVNLASSIIPPVAKAVSELAKIIEVALGMRSEIDKQKDWIRQIQSSIQEADSNKPIPWLDRLFRGDAIKSRLQDQLKEQEARLLAMTAAADEASGAVGKLSKSSEDGEVSIRGIGDGADKAADKLRRLREEHEKYNRELAEKLVRRDLDSAIDSGDRERFEKSLNELRELVAQRVREGLKEGLSAGAISEAEAQMRIEVEVGLEVDEYEKKRKESAARVAKDEANRLKDAYRDAIGLYSEIFRDAINGTSATLEDRLIDIAAGFAAAMQTGMTDASEDAFKSIEGMLQHLGQQFAAVLMEAFPETFGKMGNWFGGTKSDAQGDAGSTTGDGASGGQKMGWGQAAMQAGGQLWGSWSNRDDVDRQNNDNRGTGQAVGGTIGAIIGAFFGPEGAVLGQQIGSVAGEIIGRYIARGSQDAEQQARRQFAGILEDLAKEKNFRFVSSSGQLRTDSNFVVGSPNRFNDPNWSAEVWEKYEENAIKAFAGIGEALEDFFELAEEVGTQMGAAWLDQFGGDIEALKALVDLAGLSYEQFVEIMINRGKKGEASWLEIVSQIQAGADAWKEGLEGAGQFLQAADNFIATGGVGQVALNQMKNIAIEAKEAGIKTTDELLAQLEASGKYTAEQIEAFRQAFANNGITTIEQILDATDLQLAQLTASFDAALQDQGVDWEEQKQQLLDINGLLLEIKENSNIDLKFNISTKMDDQTRDAIEAGVFDPTKSGRFRAGIDTDLQRFATGGILNGPTIIRPGALAGEAGPEAIMPLKRVNGKLGVAAVGSMGSRQPIVFNMDFRGAQRGVEQDVRRAIEAIEDQLVERSVNQIANLVSRGAFGSSFG